MPPSGARWRFQDTSCAEDGAGSNFLRNLFQNTGLDQVETRPIDIPTDFRDFDDYWNPFPGGQGPAPMFAMSLSEASRAQLREKIQASLPFAPDGSIALIARAGTAPGIK